MIKAQDIQFWQIRKRANRRKPWEVRWRVDDSPFSRSYLTKALAETYRASLVAAARAGETFSVVTGEPVSWQRSSETFYAHARAYVALRWPDCPPNTRKHIASQLIPVVLALLEPKKSTKNRPAQKVLWRALRLYAFLPATWDRPVPDEIAAALAWVAEASRPVADLAEPDVIRAALGALSVNLDGKKAAAKTVARRRGVWHSCLEYAVERKLLSVNPVTGVRVRRTRISEAVDPRRIPNLEQARRLLAACTQQVKGKGRGPHLAAFFAAMYYAGLRPSEARHLQAVDLHLPANGWGSATLSGSTPDVGKDWTDDGGRYDPRELKHRSEGAIRIVPLPPVLVGMLAAHIAEFGTAADGRIFFDGDEQAPISNSMYWQVWSRTRKAALTPEEMAAGLAKRPYDLRHGNASLLLNSGVAHTEIARRLGHSLAVLLSTYAHWVTGLEEEANRRLDAVLGHTEPGTGNSDSGPATGQTA